MKVKEYLQQVYRLNELIDSDQEELNELNSLAGNVCSVNYSADRVQNTPIISDKMAEQCVNIIDLKNRINNEIDRYVDIKREIREKIMCVEDKNERLVLLYRYISFMKWEDIAEKMHYCNTHIFRIHKKALRNFEKIMGK